MDRRELRLAGRTAWSWALFACRVGDKVFILSADPADATRYVLCYSAVDGSQLWMH